MKPPSIEKARRTGAGKWEFWAGGQSSTASRNCECDRGSGARTEAAQKWPRSWLREREREREKERRSREKPAQMGEQNIASSLLKAGRFADPIERTIERGCISSSK